MLPVLNVGPLSLPVPQFILLIGLWVGSVLSERKSKPLLVDPGFIDRLLWPSILAGILGARLSYFARNPAAFSGEYLSLFSLNLNLFDPLGGLLIGLSVSIYIVSRSKNTTLLVLDSISPFLGIFTAAIHLSKFASGAGFGNLTELPWAINLWGGYRHPVQLYYLLGSLLTLSIILILLSRYPYTQGHVFFIFVLLTSSYLLFFSRYEASNFLLFAGIRVDQLFFWVGSLISLVFLNKMTTNNINA